MRLIIALRQHISACRKAAAMMALISPFPESIAAIASRI
jgi:hypothetical protein